MILANSLYDYWSAIVSIPGVKAVLVMLLLSAVEISPVKINPWSWIGGIIGKLLGIKAVSDKVDALEENQFAQIRVRILRFEDDFQTGKQISKDSWNQVMDDIDRYEKYTNSHPKFKNNITVATIKHIEKEYNDLLEKRAWTTNLTNEDRR